MAVLLSLLAALSYGLADFCGGLRQQARERVVGGPARGVTGGGPGPRDGARPRAATRRRGDLWWGAAAGVGNGFGTAFLYRGLSSGRMGVVAPVSGVGAAVIPVAVGVLLGERPGCLVWVGIAARLPGHLAGRPGPGGLAARPRRAASSTGRSPGSGSAPCSWRWARCPTDAGLLPLAVNQAWRES